VKGLLLRWAVLAAVAILAGLAALLPQAASAHEVLQTVARDKAIALRVYFPDGEALAYDAYEVYSPTDPSIPHQKGRTDRNGWLAFVPDAAGKWRVKVTDNTGHGLDTLVDVGPIAGGAPTAGGSAASTLGFILRPVVGLVVIGAIFWALVTVYQRRDRAS
jgi:nickel transport protein